MAEKEQNTFNNQQTMTVNEGIGSPTPSEQDYEDKNNIMEHEKGAQENDATTNDHDREPDSPINDDSDDDGYSADDENSDYDVAPAQRIASDNQQNMERIDHEQAQENDATMSHQDREPDSQINDGEENQNSAQADVLTELVGGGHVVVPNPETDGAQPLDETAQPAQVGSNTEIMMEDPDAGPDLEEQLGGIIVAEIEYANGLVDLLVMCIDCNPGTPEL